MPGFNHIELGLDGQAGARATIPLVVQFHCPDHPIHWAAQKGAIPLKQPGNLLPFTKQMARSSVREWLAIYASS